MGIIDWLRKALGGGGGQRGGFDSSATRWVYVRCRRCGEPLKARINMNLEPSESEDGTSWVVRKGLVGSGARRCFQTVEVTLTFDHAKSIVLDREITGGEFISEEEYDRLLTQAPDEEQGDDAPDDTGSASDGPKE